MSNEPRAIVLIGVMAVSVIIAFLEMVAIPLYMKPAYKHLAKRQRAFTLIELMVVVAIIAILAMIAYPTYIQHLVKGNRSAAQAVLMDIAQRQQQFLLDNRSYAADLGALGYTPPDSVKLFYDVSTAGSVGPPPSFTATAVPKANTRQASDGTLKIDQTGAKTPADKW